MNGTALNITNAVFMAGAIVAGLGVAWRLLAPSTWVYTGLVLLTGGWLACITSVLAITTGRPLMSTIAMCLVTGIGWVAARLVEHRVGLLVAAGAVVMPLRVPVPLGSETANVLLLLYAVIAVGLLAELRRESRSPQGHPTLRLPADVAVAALTLWSCMSFAWTYARPDARIDIALFILPFATMYLLVRSWIGNERAKLGPAAIGFLATMGCAAAIAIYQHVTRTIWSNPKVIVANAYAPDFRVNSIFWDPNILGRYLGVGLLVMAALMLRGTYRPRHLALGACASAIAGIALWFTYSQSSFAALSAGLIALVFAASGRRVRIALGIVAIVGMLLAPVMLRDLAGKDTSSRETVVAAGVKLSSIHPVRGIGIGSYESGVSEIARNRGDAQPKLQSSHTSPMTVFVELGVVGLGLLIMFLTAGIAPALLAPAADAPRWWAVAAMTALLVHSMFYAALIEDPLTWAALAIIAASQMHTRKDSSGLDEPHTRPTPSTVEQDVVAPPVD